MKRKTYISISLFLAAVVIGAAVWNFDTNPVSAQEKDETQDFYQNVSATEYNARDEFSLTQGGTTGVWNYGYSTSDTDNTFNLYVNNDTIASCSGGMFQRWIEPSSGDLTPQIARNTAAVPCSSIPPEALFLHPGPTGKRSVLRWTAPAAGTYLLNGVLGKQNPGATSDLKILKNATEPALFSANFASGGSQHPFNFTVTVAMGDTIDFSVGWGNGNYGGDATLLAVTIGQPVTACLTAPANLQVFVPGENSPSDVQSGNTNSSLVGDATYTNMGKVGRAFTFDGAGDYVRIEDNAAQKPTNQVTAEGWFKFNDLNNIPHLVSKPLRNSVFNSYALWFQNGGINIGYYQTNQAWNAYNTGYVPPLGVWNHYAYVLNTDDTGATANTQKLFVNGVEVFSGVAGDPIFYNGINDAFAPHPLLVGGELESDIPSFFLNGQADEVSIYGRALTQPELFNIVKQGSFGKCPPANCAQSPQGLVSWYQGEQNALDSKSNNHGTLQNGATFINGKVGQAFGFDGIDDFVASPDHNSLDITGDLTIDAWIRPTLYNPDSSAIISKRDVNNNNVTYVLFLEADGRLNFSSRQGGVFSTPLITTVTVPLNQFSHVAVTIQGSTAKIYIDGIERANTNLHPMRTASDGRMTIGVVETTACGGSGTCGFFPGQIDELSIYNRALSLPELQSIINAGQSGKCKPSPLDPPANQIAWFTGDGDTRDFLGLTPNGILQGDANFKAGRVAQTFNFDGNGDFVEVANNPNLNPTAALTLEGWVYKTGSPASDTDIAGKDGEISERQYFLTAGGNGRFRPHITTTGGLAFFNGNTAYQLNTWYHVAMTYDGAALRLYVNGVEDGSVAATGAIITTTQPFRIGGGAPAGQLQLFFPGKIDEVSLFDRALSASEIGAVYNAGTAGKLKSAITPVNLARTAKTEASFAPTIVQLADATVTFAQVTTAGTTSQSGVDLGLLPKLPTGLTFTGLAYDISTTAVYQNGSPDDVQVCFNVPSLSGFTLANLRVLHLESGAWINRTATANTLANFCTDNLTSLSPFVIVEGFAPTAANVSVGGRVVTANGNGISNAFVTLTDFQGNSRTARTASFGYYRFEEVEVGQTYVVGVQSKRFQFNTQIISVTEELSEVNFVGFSP